MFDRLSRDLRHACRTIIRMPLVATVVVMSLAVGIGVNVVVFSWLQAIVLAPLPGVSDARSFHLVEPRAETGSYPGTSWLEYHDVREQVRSFQALLAFRFAPFNVGEASSNERMYGLLVSDNYFTALGLTPAAGRFFRREEAARPGSEPVLVISHGLWQTRFRGAADVIGQTLRVNEQDLTIVGVTPEHFQGTTLGLDFALWIPATMAPVLFNGTRELDARDVRGYQVMGRLERGVTLPQAQADVDAAMRELARRYPAFNGKVAAEVLPFWRAPRGPQRMLAGALAVLQALMLLVLLAVCGNTANLMLARASTRQREVGIRIALGAGRWRIISTLLTENVLLALAGAAGGVAIAMWGTNAIRAVPMIGAFPIRFQTGVDAVGITVGVLLGVASGLLFGLAPATQLASVDAQQALGAGLRSASRSRLRNMLMRVEVALALIVLVVAGMFFRSLSETHEIDPGFTRDGVLLASYDLSGRNPTDASARDFAARLLDRLSTVAGVQSAAVATSVPLDIHGLPVRSFIIEGHARADGRPEQALMNTVSPGYFTTMGIPLVQGTDFAVMTDIATPPKVIVNEEFVRRFVAPAEPIGRRVDFRNRAYLIAGVAKNSTYESFGEAPIPIVHFSLRDRPSWSGEIHVRTVSGAEGVVAAEVRRVVRDIDPLLPLYDVRTLSEHVEKNLFLKRVPARMFAVLGPLLLVLAAIGIYAVVAYTVAQRTTEIGVRLALGASRGRVVRQMVFETLRVVISGAAIGWLVVYLVQIHATQNRPLEVSVFFGIPAVLLLVATFASWLPAARAARVDPMKALRRD